MLTKDMSSGKKHCSLWLEMNIEFVPKRKKERARERERKNFIHGI
jgi:hypothetical protein